VRSLAGGLFAVLLSVVACGCGSPRAGDLVSFATVDADADWSPDGKSIVFASSRRGGGIYLVRPDGTALRSWTSLPAAGLDWAPDSQRIAFKGKGGIYVLDVGERRPRRILESRYSQPAWAPDGRRLAVVKQERDLTSRICVVGADGHSLGDKAVLGLGTQPSWSPNGRRLAFQDAHGRIVTASLTDERRFAIADGSDPAWSPDGKLIAFYADDALWVAKADGTGDRRRLAATEEMTAGRHVAGEPSWAPDSRRIVFELLHDRGRYSRRASSLSIVDEASGDLEKVTFGGSTLDDPAWRDGIVGKNTF
jgi:Tol biopolymer transport system component